MALLSREAFFAAEDLNYKDIPVPQLGGDVRIRLMTGAARDSYMAYLSSCEGSVPPSGSQAALLMAMCIDENGANLFTMEDIEMLREKSAAVLDTIAAAAMEFNGMSSKSIPDAVKNSESGQSDDSGSDLPSPSAKA